jgi:hypothetical protein
MPYKGQRTTPVIPQRHPIAPLPDSANPFIIMCASVIASLLTLATASLAAPATIVPVELDDKVVNVALVDDLPDTTLEKRADPTVLAPSTVSSYTPYTWFASVAYCKPANTLAWNCGGVYTSFMLSFYILIMSFQQTAIPTRALFPSPLVVMERWSSIARLLYFVTVARLPMPIL